MLFALFESINVDFYDSVPSLRSVNLFECFVDPFADYSVGVLKLQVGQLSFYVRLNSLQTFCINPTLLVKSWLEVSHECDQVWVILEISCLRRVHQLSFQISVNKNV